MLSLDHSFTPGKAYIGLPDMKNYLRTSTIFQAFQCAFLEQFFIFVLGQAIDELCRKEDDTKSLTGQKSGLKIAILNLIKVNGKYLVGFFLTKNQEVDSKRVTDFLQVYDYFSSRSKFIHGFPFPPLLSSR